MKKSPYNYPYNKKEHNYKIIKILIIIFIICIIGMIVCSLFTKSNFLATNNNQNHGWIGFIKSCLSSALGFIF